MQQFNYPTVLLYGEGSLVESCRRIKDFGHQKPLIVTDKTLVKLGIVDLVTNELKKNKIDYTIFDETHPNPIEDDAIKGAKVYIDEKCDSLIAIGGGSPMDAAKAIMVLATHEGPLSKYDDAKGGDKFIVNKLPDLFAMPTTAGTGSEVGRSGVIILKETNAKTIIFHPTMMPKLAILEPILTKGLPASITAATGIDAFTHCLEAYFAPGFHPMADGIALEGMKLVIENLEEVVKNGSNLESRAKMLLAASMGATAFQKGLGMIHSIAHPLSSEFGLHHGLANALMLPDSVKFLEDSAITKDQKNRIKNVLDLFSGTKYKKSSLSDTCSHYFSALGINFGLRNYNISESDLEMLSQKSFEDGCHQTNMIPMSETSFLNVIKEAF